MKRLWPLLVIILILYFILTPAIFATDQFAGTITGEIEVGITGFHPPHQLLVKAVKWGIYQSAELKGGASIVFEEEKLRDIKAPYPGRSVIIYFPVKIKGAGFKTYKTTVKVLVKNEPFKISQSGFLMVSNNPEGISSASRIFQEYLADNSPHRFLFHHKNINSSPVTVRVRLVNPSSSNFCRVHIISALGGPDYNEISAGHLAAVRYLVSWFIESGVVVKIKPQGELVIAQEILKPNEILSGLMQFTVLDGSLPRLVLDTWGGRSEAPSITEETFQRPHGIYVKPYFEKDYIHKVGDGYTFIYIGEKPYLTEVADGFPNYGNFGVFYYIKLLLENPLDEAEDVILYFIPRSGVARGTILIEDEIIETHVARVKEEVFLKRYRLEAGEKKEVNILTFPESASNYPLYLVVRSKFISPK